MVNYEKNVEDILEFLDDLDIDHLNILDFVDDLDIHENLSFDEITEVISDCRVFDVNIICHHEAMEYLMNNVPSLQESLAEDMGYSPKTLASILASKRIVQDWEGKRGEVESFLKSLEWD